MQEVCTLYKHVMPATVTNNLKQSLIDTWGSISQNVIDEAAGQCRKWLRANMRQKDITWTSAKLKPALFRANTLHNRLFSEPATVYRGKHVVSRYFRRSYLKADEVSKSEGTRKVKYAYHF